MLELAPRLIFKPSPLTRGAQPSLEEKLTVRATNPDNMVEAAKLVELFTSAYGQNYFAKQVYDHGFWSGENTEESSFREELISIVAEDHARFVGHLSLHKAPDSGIAHLMLPAVHPAYRKYVFHLSRIFWRYVERLAERQSWQLLFHLTHVSHPVSQLVATKCFRSIEVALLPNYLLPAQPSARHCRTKTSLLASINSFYTEALPVVTIYPPERHLAAIKELYHPLRLDRIIAPGSSVAPIYSGHASRAKPEALPCSLTGMCRIFIAPSEVADINAIVREEALRLAQVGKRLFVFLALDDPHCPFSCQALERDGYRFCGILPVIGGRDALVLACYDDSELEGLTLYSTRAKGLREYLLQSATQDPHRLH